MKKTYLYSLIFIILIQIIYLFLVFSYFKCGYHSDEVYNYGFSNSYYMKDLDNSKSDDSIFQKWNSSQLFKDYISVDKEHRFAFDSVIKNCNMDYNPPFQFMVLHTICSFFPGVFSWYFCFIINIVSFIVSQIFIFKLAKSISKNEIIGLCSIILFGFCVGAMDIVIFMRIYALGTMFIVLFMYFSDKIYSNRLKNNKGLVFNLIVCFVSLLLGAYSMHVFLIPAFAITLCFCLFYLFSKRIKLFFTYGFTCLGSVLLSILLYPKTLPNLGINISKSDVSMSEMSYALIKYPLPMQLRLYAFQFTRDLFGIHISAMPNPYLEWFLIGLACVIVLIAPFCFVFRKEEWFKKICKSIINRFLVILKKIRYFNISLIALLFASILVWFVAAWKTSWFLMKVCANRYLFVAYPLAAVFGVVTTYYIIKLISDRKKMATIIIILLSCLLSFWSHLVPQSHAFLFEHESEGLTIDDLGIDSNCVLLLDSSWTIVFFAPKLYDTNSFLATTMETYKDNKYFENANKEEPYYLILSETYMLSRELDENDPDDHDTIMIMGDTYELYTLESNVVSFFEDEDKVDYLELVGTDDIMKRKYHIYKVHFVDE